MHINTMYEAQAIKLLAEVCDALGIDQDNRTREEIRAKLREIKELQKQSSVDDIDERMCDKCESSMEYYDGHHCPTCDNDVRSCNWDK